jgi:hypothetical protein
LRLAENKMAKKINMLEDLVREIEDLIADLAPLQAAKIEGLPHRPESKGSEPEGRIPGPSSPAQAPP